MRTRLGLHDGETRFPLARTALAILSRTSIMYLHNLESGQAIGIRAYIGDLKPAFCTAEGRVLLAYSPPAVVAEVVKEGLSGSVDLRLQDYRDVRGGFDRIVSIEMIEAVGEKYWPAYFGAIHDRLNAGGEAVLQVITIADERFEDYRRATDFIQHYVFPGGMLPTKSIMQAQAASANTMELPTSTRSARLRMLMLFPDLIMRLFLR